MREPARLVPFDRDAPELDVFLRLTDVQARAVREPEEGLYIAEGLKVVRRAIAAGHQPRVALATSRWVPDLLDVLPREVPVHVGSEEELQGLTGYRVHRGGLVCFGRPQDPGLDAVLTGARRLVLLEDLKEHTNVGSIVRAARALQVDGMVLSPGCADPLYRRAVKVSMGTIFDLPWTRSDSWPDDLDRIQQAGFTIAALTPDPYARDLADLAAIRPERLAWVLGTEGPGLTAATRSRSTLAVRIPMAHGVDSLNVAAAAAVAFYATTPADRSPAPPHPPPTVES